MSSLTLSARLEKSKVARGKKHEVHLLVGLEGKKLEGDRKPLKLGVAIDCSTSMSGDKLENAKRGLVKLVENLTEQDTLGVVAFSDNIWTVVEAAKMTQEAKEKAKHEIEGLHVVGSTNLSAGTREAYLMIKAQAEKKIKDAVNRAFVFTDGNPTAGEQDHQALVALAKNERPEDTNLICFGYGSDYNRELMVAMAKAAGGDAYHIENPDQFGPRLGAVLGGLLTCVAQNVKLTIKTKPDVKILEVLNDFDVKGNTEQTEAVVTVDDVYSEEKRHVLLRLELPEADKSARPFTLGAVSITYQDLVSKELRTEDLSFNVEYVKEAEADKDSDKAVMEQVALLKSAQAQLEAKKLADQGMFTQAKAVLRGASLQLQDVGTAFACSVAKDLDENVQEFLSPSNYAQGGAHYLHSNAGSYRSGRGHTVGSAGLFGTKAAKAMADSFTEPPQGQPAAPGTGLGQPLGALPGAPGFMVPNQQPHQAPWKNVAPGTSIGPVNDPPTKKPSLSKKRTRR